MFPGNSTNGLDERFQRDNAMSMETEKIIECFPDLIHIAPIHRASGQKHAYTAVSPTYGEVVVKVVCPFHNDPRIIREIQIMRDCTFAHVPKLHDCRVVDSPLGQILISIEKRVNGKDLCEILSTSGKFPFHNMLRLSHDILSILCEVEKQGIVHRDIKPANILQDEDGQFWLIDFGIARVLGAESITDTAAVEGPATLGYASPEQMDNMKADISSRSDLFSLGVVLTECILGYNPFIRMAHNRYEAKSRVRHLDVHYPIIPDDKNGAFVNFVKWLTEKRPMRRPKTAEFALASFNSLFSR